MPTRVVELEIEALPRELRELAGYDTALILLRYRSRPVGRLEIPVREGRIKGAELRDGIEAVFGPDLCQAWLDALLEEELPAAPRSSALATIAVCTRARPADLQRCLQSLDRLPDDGQEVLVVDNCPPDDSTYQVVCAHRRARYLREDRRGLDNARNRALREARGQFVAFIDDDAVADSGWLRALGSNFADPLTLAVTGLTMPAELETPAQVMFERLSGFSRGFRRRTFTIESLSPAAGGAAGAGTNMALRRDVLEKLGPFDPALDAGTLTQSGGDAEMFARILAAGYSIVYEPSALNWHRHRKSWPELRQTMYGYGVGLYAAWTRSLLVDREWGVLRVGARWFARVQLRRALESLLGRTGAYPRDLLAAELWGSAVGPWAYLLARRRAK